MIKYSQDLIEETFEAVKMLALDSEYYIEYLAYEENCLKEFLNDF